MKVIRSTLVFCRSMTTLPVACAASQWKMMPFERQNTPISSIGWITPISLFTSMTDTRMVSGRTAAASCSTVIRPLSCGSRYVASKPMRSSSRTVSSTDLCSVLTVMMCLPLVL
ncbi:hypothetical protein D3C72_1732180 [compost metagenome]